MEQPGAERKWVSVDGALRPYTVYIPRELPPSAGCVFLLGRNGARPEELLSGWRRVADREKLVLFILEPAAGGWETGATYGPKHGDLAYVDAVVVKAQDRKSYCIHESAFYLYGEGEGGTVAHMAAMDPPADRQAVGIIWAGLATVRADSVPRSYAQACARAQAVDLMGVWDESGAFGLRKGDIPMPVLTVGSDRVALDHWLRANGAEEIRELPEGIREHHRRAAVKHPLGQDAEAFRVWEVPEAVLPSGASDRADWIWERFLSRHRRWMGDPGGELRLTERASTVPGMERFREEIGGHLREWYLYIPEKLRSEPWKPVPLVIALHGYSCTGDIYIGNSGWHRVAAEHGFLVVYPTALPGRLGFRSVATDPDNMPLPAWNFLHDAPGGPDEFLFFRTLLDRVEAVWPVDRRRVFITGHSHGSMMTQALALGMPELFAGAAPCSGVILGPMFDDFVALPELWRRQEPVPIWMFAGTREEWLIDPEPSPENATGKTLEIWHERNGLPGSVRDRFRDGWTHSGERWHDLICRDGAGRAMLRFTAVEGLPHATGPEMSRRIWEEFFSHLYKEDGYGL